MFMVPISNKYYSLSHYVLTFKYNCNTSTTYWEQEKYILKLTYPLVGQLHNLFDLYCHHKLTSPKKNDFTT